MAGRRGRGTRATSARSSSAYTKIEAAVRRQGRLRVRRQDAPLLREAEADSVRTSRRSIRRRRAITGPLGRRAEGRVWVRPELVIRVELAGWSRDGMVRQAAYKGLEAGPRPARRPSRDAVATTAAVRSRSRGARHPTEMTPCRRHRRTEDRRHRRRSRAEAAAQAAPAPATSPTTGASPTTSWPPSRRSARKASWQRRTASSSS